MYVNVQQVHKIYIGYNPFAVDATEQMVSGVNTIAVFVRNEQPSSRWYSGSGMIRPVELVTLLDDQIRMENIRVTTPKLDSDLTNGETVITFDAVNKTGAEAAATFTVDLYDPDGAKVGTADASAVIAAGETQNVSATVAYRSPKLWHISDAQQRDLMENGKSVSASGNPLTCENALPGKPLCALHVYGKSTQNGVPTPTAPVPIVSAGDGGTVTVTVSDGANNSQTLTLQTPNALPGIPVASSGNYTDESGQHWVCDEVDLTRGVRVQRITKIKVTSSLSWQTTGNAVDRYFAWFSGIYTSNVLWTHFSTALGSETVGGAIANQNNLVGFAFAEKGTTTLDDFKQFLDENDVFIWAALATPVETDISADEVAAYKALTTYAQTTVISASGGAGMAASYQQSILPSNAPAALWTASPANLYEAQISAKVGNRVQRSKRVTYGYRSIRFDKDTGFYLNGIHTKLKGVCVHHDGGCIGAAENRSAIERQVDILTNMGCNAIRLTHNPFGAEYLDVCQRKGVLLVEELFDGWTKSKKQKDFGRYFADHYAEVVTSAIRRDWNNPAVIMWSLGNECKNPEILRTILVQPYVNQMGETHVLHAYDPTRPWHYEQARDNFATGIDVYSGMYETVEQMIAYAEAGHDTPYIECEYEHAMGNAMGNMDEYQAAFDTYRSLQGGFIWDFIDQSIYQTAEDGTRYFGYGGDFGERVHDDYFCANGLLLPARTLQPEMAEVRYQYSQLKFDAFDEDHATVRMKNYFLFTDVAEKYEFRWNITADGDVAAEGVLPADAVRVANVDARTNQPGERVVTLNLPTIAKEAGKECFLNLTVALKAQDGLLNAGHVVAYEQFAMRNDNELTSMLPDAAMTVTQDGNVLSISGEQFRTALNLETAQLTRYEALGADGTFHALIVPGEGPKGSFYRAATDNDRAFGSGLGHMNAAWKEPGTYVVTNMAL